MLDQLRQLLLLHQTATALLRLLKLLQPQLPTAMALHKLLLRPMNMDLLLLLQSVLMSMAPHSLLLKVIMLPPPPPLKRPLLSATRDITTTTTLLDRTLPVTVT